jgi:hypothetical protein
MFNLDFGVPSRPVSASASAFGVNGFQISSTNYQWVHTLTANPTTRPDGTALLSGDQIQDSTTGEMWRWNGTLWLSREFQAHSWTNSFGNNSNFNTIVDIPIGRGALVKEVIYSYLPAGTVNTTATVTLTTTLRTLGAASAILFTQPLPLATNFTNGVRTATKIAAGVTVPASVGATTSGVALNVAQTLGFTLSAFSFGLRLSLVR